MKKILATTIFLTGFLFASNGEATADRAKRQETLSKSTDGLTKGTEKKIHERWAKDSLSVKLDKNSSNGNENREFLKSFIRR